MLLGTGITIKVLIFIYSKESGIWGRALQSKDFQLHFCFSSWATIYFHGKSDPLFPSGIKRGFLTRKLTFSKLPSQRVQIQTDKDSWTHEETPRANRYTAYSKCKLLHTNTELACNTSTAHHQLCNTIRGSTQHPQHGQRGALPVTATNKRRSWAILLATGGWLVGFLFRKRATWCKTRQIHTTDRWVKKYFHGGQNYMQRCCMSQLLPHHFTHRCCLPAKDYQLTQKCKEKCPK